MVLTKGQKRVRTKDWMGTEHRVKTEERMIEQGEMVTKNKQIRILKKEHHDEKRKYEDEQMS